MATWPAALPVPIRPGYSGGPGSTVQRTDMDAGSARQRQRFTDSPEDRNVTWRFTIAEMAIFRAFWEDDINRGADWFDMDMDIGFGMQPCEVRFVSGKYQESALAGMNRQVSAQLDVRSI